MPKTLSIQATGFKNFFSKLFSFLNKNKTNQPSGSLENNERFVYIIPEFPWSVGAFPDTTLDEDIHTQPLLGLLKRFLPDLYMQWRWQVIESARLVKRQEEKLKALQEEQKKLASQIADNQAALKDIPDSQPESTSIEQESKPQDPWYLPYLTVGISFMLFLGMCEYFGVDLKNFNGEDLPLLLVSAYGAISFTFIEKLGIQTLVESSLKQNNSPLKNPMAFWERYKSGDSALWLATGFVVIETAFAAPGLLSKMPPTVAAQFLTKITVASAAGLAAYANVVFAWAAACQKIDWQRERAEQLAQNRAWLAQAKEERAKDPQTEINRKCRMDAAAASSQLELINQQIADQTTNLANITEKARTEYERWELEVKRWLWHNAEKVEESYHDIQANREQETDYSSKNPTIGHLSRKFDQYL